MERGYGRREGRGRMVHEGVPPDTSRKKAALSPEVRQPAAERPVPHPNAHPRVFANELNCAQESAGFPGDHSFWDTARSGIRMPAATWSWV